VPASPSMKTALAAMFGCCAFRVSVVVSMAALRATDRIWERRRLDNAAAGNKKAALGRGSRTGRQAAVIAIALGRQSFGVG
jgi:hypothetical protein